MKLSFIAFLVAMIITVLLTPRIREWARRNGVIANPGGRRTHKEPTPLWGGIAMIGGFWAAVGLSILLVHLFKGVTLWSPTLTTLAVVGTLVALFGVLDDKHQFSAATQIGVLLFAGFLVALFGIRIEGVTNPFASFLPDIKFDPARHWIGIGVLAIPATMIWIFLVTKTMDTIDGLDGLAAGVAAISAMTISLMALNEKQLIIAVTAASLAGACVGFLRHNINPASIFMGTAGAQFLGFVLAVLSVAGAFKMAVAFSVALPVLILGVPILDAVFVILRRAIDRAPIHQADNRHLHYWLRSRLGTRKAVFAVWCIAAAFCIAALSLYSMTR